MPFVCSLPLEDSEQQYCDEGRPNLYLHGIRRCAYKTLDMEVLLEVAKEDFNVPPCLVEVGDGSSREFHVVGEQYHREMVLSVIYGNPAYALGVLSGRAVSCQPHDFVYGNSSAFRRTNWSDIRDATPLSTLMSNVLWMIS